MSAVFALLASLVWGTSDYVGGSAARTVPVAWVLFIGQTCAFVALSVVVTVFGLWHLDAGIAWGAASGAVGPIALAAFYTALSTGTMGVVAPVASCGVVIPVAVGVVEGEQPGILQIIGILVTIGGVVFAGRAVGSPQPTVDYSAHRRSVLLAAVAAAGFGIVLICIAEGSRSSAGTTLAVQRLVSMLLVGGVLLRQRPPLRATRREGAQIAGSGLGDAGANALYAAAVTGGLVSINAVLSSLYPVVTALLARQVDGERLARAQAAGVATALIGVVLLAAG